MPGDDGSPGINQYGWIGQMEIKQTTKTSFLKVMGANPINKTLDFLIENERDSWTMAEISKNAGVGYSTLKLVLPKLLKNELIFIDKQIGKLKLYKINKENKIVSKLYLLHNTINKESISNI